MWTSFSFDSLDALPESIQLPGFEIYVFTFRLALFSSQSESASTSTGISVPLMLTGKQSVVNVICINFLWLGLILHCFIHSPRLFRYCVSRHLLLPALYDGDQLKKFKLLQSLDIFDFSECLE